jgi:MoxR-like ATPase
MLPLSPRAGKSLVRAVKALAFLAGRDYATADDVQTLFPYLAEHRLNPQSVAGVSPFSQQLLEQTPCPL